MSKYIYHFVRRDIPVVAQIIQVGHAIDRIALRQEYYDDVARTVLFEVPNEEALLDVYAYLRDRGLEPSVDFEMFYDSEWPKGFNAIATRPFEGAEREVFKGFTLYRDTDLEATKHRKDVHITE